MHFDPIHHRRSIRLKEFDYSQPGAYFVTVVAWHRRHLFGKVVGEEFQPNPFGKVVLKGIHTLPRYFPARIDAWVVMPNHVHLLLSIADPDQGGASADQAAFIRKNTADAPPLPNPIKRSPLGTIIQNLKSVTARQINRMRGTPGAPVWQRNYYEHIVRNEEEMNNLTLYIIDNPRSWAEDPEHN